jgi:hypothetical protein
MPRKKRPPIHTDPTENADQAELAAWRSGMAPIGYGIIDERLAGADDDYLGDPQLKREEWERDKAYEEAENSTTTEIQRRIDLLGEAYPFTREGSRLVYTAKANYLYEFLLGLSLSESYSKGKRAVLPRVFEVISCLIAEIYLGEDAESFRMGWPRPKGVATTLKAAVDELHIKAGNYEGEWVWGPKQGNPEDPTPQRAKEQGLDIVAWKKSPDGRTGQLYLLGQCACGKGWDSDAKLQDLSLSILNEWISEIACVKPVRAIFTPRHAMDDRLPFLSRQGGMVFDRARLALLGAKPRATIQLASRQQSLQRLTKLCAA